MNLSSPYLTKSPQSNARFGQTSLSTYQHAHKSADRGSSLEQSKRSSQTKFATKSPLKTTQKTSKNKASTSPKLTRDLSFASTTTKEGFTDKDSTTVTKKRKQNTSPTKMNELDETETVRHHIANLQKSFDSQEKILRDLDCKLNAEKLELSQLSKHLSAKKLQEDPKEEALITRSQSPSNKKKVELLASHGKQEEKYNTHISENANSHQKTQKVAFKDQADIDNKTSTIFVPDIKLLSSFSSEENFKHKWLQLKDYVSSMESHYKLKIEELKLQNDKLTEENYHLKYRNGSSNKNQNEDHFSSIESIYRSKIAKAEAKWEQKEKEILSREVSFKQELELLHSRIFDLQLQLNKKSTVEEKLQDIKSKMQLREKEISDLKIHYSEKLQRKSEEITKIKAENSKMQMEFHEEIRKLKGTIDHMFYENRKLSFNQSNYNTHTLMSSLIK